MLNWPLYPSSVRLGEIAITPALQVRMSRRLEALVNWDTALLIEIKDAWSP